MNGRYRPQNASVIIVLGEAVFDNIDGYKRFDGDISRVSRAQTRICTIGTMDGR